MAVAAGGNPLGTAARWAVEELLNQISSTVDGRGMDFEFSAGWIFASLFASLVGFGLFLYGKKQARIPQLVTGMALMIFPGFMTSPLWILVLAGALVGGLWIAIRTGV